MAEIPEQKIIFADSESRSSDAKRLSKSTASHMDRNPLNKGALTENLAGSGTVTPEMVHTRARELVLLAGYAPPHVRQADYEQAKRELTGESDVDRQDAVLEALPEAKRWDPLHGSIGHHARESPSEDEDAEGRSETEPLVDEGAVEAAHDRMVQAARATEKPDQREP